MSDPATISPAIVETLYEDALQLAEEARALFDTQDARAPFDEEDTQFRIALSCEGLRTTTRIMHAIAWLLNHRAYFAGEMTEFQLRRHGRLPPPQPEGDARQLAMMDLYTRSIIDRSRSLYARIERLDAAWRRHYAMQPEAVHRLRERIGQAFAVS
ncbi:DUF1465 family protein [Aurantiacibacter sediminis]|uniref:DUF1465 family protein n=1 Tax=Aurantiacibacter sediminis TaxID=2793064 RepID=A0ABS0N6Q8_9SPHN|nr:DUF1465 family protein [Aurantiacibacter sediminis]MBH5323512.1 DUF1465 family protein [Aurantiacibacter sediminis]